jgi:two-component system, NarL family, sensor histidine kinase DesK
MPGRMAKAGWLSTATLRSSDSISGQVAANIGASTRTLSAADELHGGPRLARAILLTVLCGFLAVQVIDILTSPIESQGYTLAVGLTSICVVFVLQVFNSSAGAAQWSMGRRLGMLLAQAIVTYVPLLVLGKEWAGMAGFLAGSILLLVPGWAAWVLFTAVVTSMLVGPLLLGLGAYSVAYLTVATLDIGLVVFGLSRLSSVIRYAHAKRAELAQLAVLNERMRFARDLHDLLGYSLSAITLKAELTRRLVSSNPSRARDELAELLDIARQALADVRLVASGYRNISLAKEAASVASLLSTAGITAKVEINCGPLDEKVDTVLATVLREAVTNMLRHSSAQNCSIEADLAGETVYLRMTNDGVPRSAASGRHGGGLENLTTRLAAVGGKLTATSRDGHFDLLAEVAIPAATVEIDWAVEDECEGA